MSLCHLSVIITRPIEQARDLQQKIIANQGVAIMLPALKIVALQDNDQIEHVRDHINQYEFIIFTSRNAVSYAQSLSPAIKQPKIIAIGPSTAAELAKIKLPVAASPSSAYSSEQVLALPLLANVAGKSILIITGRDGRLYLTPALEGRGATVTTLSVYERQRPSYTRETLQDLTRLSNAIVVTTSCEGLANFKLLCEEAGQADWLDHTPLLIISERMRQFAQKQGFAKNLLIMATDATDESILDCLNKWYSKQKSN